MERLTLACMAHLPTSILFVLDLTGVSRLCSAGAIEVWLCCFRMMMISPTLLRKGDGNCPARRRVWDERGDAVGHQGRAEGQV